MTYDSTGFIAAAPRVPGFYDVSCRIRWTPNDASPHVRTVVGPYLDGDSPSGSISLGCGIEAALSDLGISDLLDDVDHIVAVADLVSGQLADRPWAEVRCREGTARIDLLPLGLVEHARTTALVNPNPGRDTTPR